MKELDLGNEKISKLLFKFSVPCVISMLVASLYNIVDQIYIGHIKDVGVFCNAATNVVFPLTLIALAICLLLGDGATSLFSLSKGRKDDVMANRAVENGLVLQIICLVILTIICLIFKEQILDIFGVTSKSYQYAYDYLSIIVLGFPAYMFGQGLNSIIRADGSPKYAMIVTTIGAILNIILDPIFIFIFDLGIKGAAIATVIGQFVTFVLTVIYLFKLKSFKITKESLKLNKGVIKTISMLGISSFVTQVSIVIIIAICNNLIKALNDSYYGDTIPLAVIGIVMKVFGIVISICIGISVGGQPIVGYNYGAGNIDRVKETFKKIIIICTIVGVIAFILFQFFPDVIIRIFGTDDTEAYLKYARLCFKIYLSGIIFTCIIKASTIFLQSCGSSLKSMTLSILRDVILFAPALLILGLNFGVVNMLWAALIADVLTMIFTIIFIRFEFKKLDKKESLESDDKLLLDEKTPIFGKRLVITISREYGSGGRYVGELLASKLGIKCYDKELISMIAEEGDFSEDYIKKNEEKKIMLGGSKYNNADKLFIAETNVIRKIAKKENCIVVGRCANYILKDFKDTYNIFLYSNDDDKVKRVVKYYGVPKDKAREKINKMNRQRERYYNHYTNWKWKDYNNYDLAINVDTLGVEKTAEMIKNIVIDRNKK